MGKFLDLGLGISIVNVYYSLSYFLMWCVALQQSYENNDIEPFVWLSVYTCNVFLNAFLFLGLRKRDRLAVIIWFSLTLLWFLPKLYDHQRGCRLDNRGSTYQVFNLIMEVYVIISFIVMGLVFKHLPNKKRQTAAVRQSRTSADNQYIQMQNLSVKPATTGTEEQQKCLTNISSSSQSAPHLDQQVSSFEFHRAAAELDDNSEDSHKVQI